MNSRSTKRTAPLNAADEQARHQTLREKTAFQIGALIGFALGLVLGVCGAMIWIRYSVLA